jgi:hypothetical protein
VNTNVHFNSTLVPCEQSTPDFALHIILVYGTDLQESKLLGNCIYFVNILYFHYSV